MVKRHVHHYSKAFLTGIVTGIGWVVGATLGITILLGILATVFHTLESLPFIGKYFNELNQITQQIDQGRQDIPKIPTNGN
jgi:hypothetical protein